MSKLHLQLDVYAQGLRRVVEALDANAEAEELQRLSEEAQARFAELLPALEVCSTSERAQLAPQLQALRTWAGLAAQQCTGQRAKLSARLGDVGRTRQALAMHHGTPPGGSCDVAG